MTLFGFALPCGAAGGGRRVPGRPVCLHLSNPNARGVVRCWCWWSVEVLGFEVGCVGVVPGRGMEVIGEGSGGW